MGQKLRTKIMTYFYQIFQDGHFSQRLQISRKEDKSLVSQVDQFISQLIKTEYSSHHKFASYAFLSEEEHDSDLRFPTLILDPIDGTHEMIRGIPECAVSLGIFADSKILSPHNESWIFNPFTGMEVFSLSPLPPLQKRGGPVLLGMVSRREWEEGTFHSFKSPLSPQITLHPKGSIAYKLGLLAAGASDFVVSLRPKKIWDIAAGSNLCCQRGFVFLEGGIKVTHLDKWVYRPPLLWCREEEADFLSAAFKI
jgi:myo-inositol-1(or 4)-monophosphatase